MALLQVDNLTVEFETASGWFRAVDGISVSVEKGEVLAIVGESGSGKSVSMLAVMGLLPWTAKITADRMLFEGKDIQNIGASERRKLIGKDIAMIFQEPVASLNPCFTVGFQLEEVLRIHMGMDKKTRHARAIELFKLVGLPDPEERLKHFPHQMSGGQCQRVALARSLVTRPRLLLLDEPLSALDARIRKHLREQIRQIQRELGLTTIFVTHDQEEALTMSDRIFLMNQGKIVQSGDAETLYTAPVDVFAAGFIGNYNLLDADKASQLLQRPISGRIAIRPEAIELSRSGELDALVRSHSLLGNVIRYRIEARGVELVVDVLNRSADDLHPDGQRLALSIDPSALCEVA